MESDLMKEQGQRRCLALVQIYSLYERFWHWTQAALIFTLLLSGLAMHGSLPWPDFETAHWLHVWAALALMALWLLTIFWQFATGNWRHFVPLLEERRSAPTFRDALRGWLIMSARIVRHYAWGILRGEPHPYRKRLARKHNPLQALAYFALMAVIGPLIWLSGLVLLGHGLWQPLAVEVADDILAIAAALHTAGAWLMLAFVIGHVYMATLGKTPAYLIRGMISGVEEVEIGEDERRWLERHAPRRLVRILEECR